MNKKSAISNRLRRQPRQDGFALAALIFFLTATSILIAAAIPDYLMEAQRQQEKELIFRGQEYVRAIQKFQRKYKVYPPSIDALLDTNQIRFLRQAYTDPITGKPFRLITLNADGSVSGSVLYTTGSSITNSSVGGSLGSTSIGNSSLNSTGLNGATSTGSSMSSTGSNSGSLPSSTSASGSANGSTNGSSGFSMGTFSSSGATSSSTPSSSAPSSSASASTTAASAFGTPSGGSTGTAGIIGVASNSDLESIMIYNTRQKYKEWEFIALQQAASTTPSTTTTSGTNANGSNSSGTGTNGTNGTSSFPGATTQPTTPSTKPPG